MPVRKRTREVVWQLTLDVFCLKMSLVKAAKLNNLSKRTAQLALKDAVDYNYISKKTYSEYLQSAPMRGYRALRKNFDSENDLRLFYSDMGIKSAASGLERLTEQARTGGLATQEKHGKKVAKNLKNAKRYGSTGCSYDNVFFASEGERMTALVLQSYGLIDNIVEGENFQKEFGRVRVDFYINDKLIIEYHPIPKQTFRNSDVEVASSIDSYVDDRVELLKDYFQGKIIAIAAPSGKFSATEFYKKAGELGITDSWGEFLKKCREVKKQIDISEKQYALDLKNNSSDDECPF